MNFLNDQMSPPNNTATNVAETATMLATYAMPAALSTAATFFGVAYKAVQNVRARAAKPAFTTIGDQAFVTSLEGVVTSTVAKQDAARADAIRAKERAEAEVLQAKLAAAARIEAARADAIRAQQEQAAQAAAPLPPAPGSTAAQVAALAPEVQVKFNATMRSLLS